MKKDRELEGLNFSSFAPLISKQIFTQTGIPERRFKSFDERSKEIMSLQAHGLITKHQAGSSRDKLFKRANNFIKTIRTN